MKQLALGSVTALKDYVEESLDVLTFSQMMKLAKEIKNLNIETLKEQVQDAIKDAVDLVETLQNIEGILYKMNLFTLNDVAYHV